MGVLIENTITERVNHNMVNDCMAMRFKFIEADIVNGNKRRYPKAVLESAFRSLKERAQAGKVMGSDHHPKEADLDTVTHLIEDVYLHGRDGIAHVKILPTARGKNLMAIVANGGRLGISARGNGSVKDMGGVNEVQPDYKLASIDFVTSPSFNVFAGAGEVYESLDPTRNAITEALKQRWYAARIAGYRGDLEDYVRQFEKH
jgi:hypothetical protein